MRVAFGKMFRFAEKKKTHEEQQQAEEKDAMKKCIEKKQHHVKMIFALCDEMRVRKYFEET